MQQFQFGTNLLPASAVGVGDDVQQWIGQVAVTAEGVVPPTDGDVGEISEGRHRCRISSLRFFKVIGPM